MVAFSALVVAACSPTVTGNGQAGVTVIRGGVPTVVDPSEVSPSESTITVTSTVTSTVPTTSRPAEPIAIPDNGNGYTFMETKTGKTRCRVSETGAGCQLAFDKPGPKTASGDTANGVNVGSDGVLTYVLGDIGVANPAPMDYATYTARGWTIEASEAGTRFTNQATGHGMFVSTGGATSF